jgi:hypothetical protein
MRKVSLLVAAGAALVTTGCVETMDSGYPNTAYGYNEYSSGYYASNSYPSGYYGRPSYTSNTYVYNPPPKVVTQTRYVPVPVATPALPARQQANHSNSDRRWEGRRHDNNAHATNPPSTNNDRRGNKTDNNRGSDRRRDRDRDGDGKPDRRS